MPDKSVEDIIRELESTCKDGNYIFRGTNRGYSKASDGDGVNSSLYRTYKEEIGQDEYNPFTTFAIIEKISIPAARRHFPGITKDEEILTDIRHYGGNASFIDFTTNLYVALFFACYEKYGTDYENKYGPDGEVVLLKCDNIMQVKSIDDRDEKEIKIIDPAITQGSRNRVIAQHSIFVHTPKGYIEREKYIAYSIDDDRKKELLEYLRKYHGIHAAAMYNDMQGFIANELVNYQHAVFEFIRAVKCRLKKNYKEAIEHLDTSIALSPNHALTYYNRGMNWSILGEFKNALDDYNRVIETQPENLFAHYFRGEALSNQDRHQEAIADFTTAKNLESKSAKHLIGMEKGSLKQLYQTTIGYCEKAKSAIPDLAAQADKIIAFCQSRIKELDAE